MILFSNPDFLFLIRIQSRKEINQLKKNVRLKDTNRAAQERQIQSKEAELQRKNKEIQILKQKIKESNHKQISKSTNGVLHSNDNKRSNKMPRTRQNFLKVSQL